ncbi:MAG: hypothetical protein M1833_004996 [Piccolia ochrophora]|nr:MAG: hypothetical protein M1833_004996 [Piccolia ochrophora]
MTYCSPTTPSCLLKAIQSGRLFPSRLNGLRYGPIGTFCRHPGISPHALPKRLGSRKAFTRPPSKSTSPQSSPTKPSTLPKGPSALLKPTASTTRTAIYRTFADTLALRQSPTLLYQAPPHAGYIIGSYTSGLFCITYAGYNFIAHYLQPPVDLPGWVPIAFGFVCFFMTCMGTWLLLAPSRLIRTITAIPIGTTPRSITLEVRLRRWLPIPFMKPRTFTCPPQDVTITPRLFEHPPPALSLAEVKRQEEKQREFERARILTAPFRHLSYACWRGLRAVKRVWTREGFSNLKAKGERGVMKLDREGGWALDEGRGLDRLVQARA